MDGNSVLLFLLILSAVIQDGEAARLAITPSQNLPAGSASLTLRCSPISNAVYTVLYSITINKRTLVENSQTTVTAVIDGTGTKSGTGITPPKYTVTGNYNITEQPTQSFLQVVINNPDCNDAAEYQCITTGQPTVSSNPANLQEDKNVTVQSNPGMVEMIRLQEKIQYDVGEKIEITCQGDVGNPEKLWSWESKSVVDSFYNPITENITKGQVDQPSSTRCGYYSRSILNYYVGQGDNGLEIRCMVNNSDQYSANKTICLLTSNPNTIEMIRSPEKMKYSVGENIEITCQGDVGNPEKLWSWESKSVGDSFFKRITENITKGEVESPSSTRCGYYSRSILNYYVGQGDNGLEIRCKVDNVDQYSANKTICLLSNPGTVEMIRSPAKMKYDIGEKIEIACQADVENPERFWSWESKSVGDSLFKRITVNITKGQVDPPSTTRCGYYSRSILNYYVGQGDNGLEIRCKVDNSDQYSANETIYLTGTTIGDSGSHIVSGAVSYVSGIMVMVMVGVVY